MHIEKFEKCQFIIGFFQKVNIIVVTFAYASLLLVAQY